MFRLTTLGALLVPLICGAAARAEFLDFTSLTPGPAGSFAGTLGAVPVTGSITGPAPGYSFAATGSDFFESTTDDTSPQYSYAGIYTPTDPMTDRVGYIKVPDAASATVTILFGSPVTDPVFHVANLDASFIDFSPTAGITLSLLSGNGGGDGLGVSGTTIFDIDPTTVIGFPPTSPPPTAGPRSAYGSVQLLGTYTTLTFIHVTDTGGDGGSFTLSASPAVVPEPSTLVLAFTAVGCLLPVAVRRMRRRSR